MIEVYGIVGNPVAHSKSPQMHNAVFKKLEIDAVYVRITAANAQNAMSTAEKLGLKGFNVTAPFKQDFLEIVDEIDEDAKAVGAVNTVIRKDKWIGYNTDVDGVKQALLSNGVEVRRKKACVIGAGGAAKAAAHALMSEGAEVTIANRTQKKAKQLAEELNCRYCSLDDILCDVIVSCVSTLDRIVPKKILRRGMVIFDANYAGESALVSDAKEHGCKIIDGREWLLFQGEKVFELFTERKAPVQTMRKAVYQSERNAKRNIALTGFMGSGKSTVAKIMAKKREAIDIDEEIEKGAGTSITKIFEEGEEKFRKLENDKIAELENKNDCVIACGGGCIIDKDNVKMLKNTCLVFLLWANKKTIMERIGNDKNRPLLKSIDELMEKRFPLYMKAADVIVDTEGKTPEETAEMIEYEVDKAIEH
ncbi:shikimate dehydrogenase [Candidatus Micrarchaeota archaeon]|nr:shikimate dehydrogenase [Candidatus Micrarchaeota archaeon]